MSETAFEPLRRLTLNLLLFTEFTALLPMFFLVQARPSVPVVVLIATGTVVLMFFRVRGTLSLTKHEARPVENRRVYSLSALGILIVGIAGSVEAQWGGFTAILVGLAASEFFVSRRLGDAAKHVAIVVLVQTAVLATVSGIAEPPVRLPAVGLAAFMAVTIAFAVGFTYRQWDLAVQLEQARRNAAELATTRERLRLAEDLHDILGHALEVVSLKSELAVRLADPDKSKAEMAEVQRLARNALRDVRALAKGNRPTDFATELTGARNLLDSAGISCDFTADPAMLTNGERDLFGRVLRETITNALRHSDPHNCSVSLTKKPNEVVLRVVNDGVAPLRSAEDGSGLASLARRVKAAGGSFTAGTVDPESFEVIASLPR